MALRRPAGGQPAQIGADGRAFPPAEADTVVDLLDDLRQLLLRPLHSVGWLGEERLRDGDALRIASTRVPRERGLELLRNLGRDLGIVVSQPLEHAIASLVRLKANPTRDV